MYKVGMYGGTFDPIHLGHVTSIVKASTMCEELYIILCYSLKSDKIDHKLRYKWIKEITSGMDNVIVKEVCSDNSSKKDYDWSTGRDDILKTINKDIDIVFAGSDYENKNIFESLYPTSKVYYFDRNIVNVSSTDIRNNPFKYYEYIPNNVRSYYNKKIIIVGTESCGKSTLVRNLAKVYNTNYLEEVGRDICEEYGGIDNMSNETYLKILLTHKLKELESIKYSNKILFIDTDALITLYYYILGFEKTNEYNKNIVSLANTLISINKYDKYLFLEPEVKWVQDGTRTYGEESIRIKNNKKLKSLLKKHNIDYEIVRGDYEGRFNKIKEIVASMI